MRRRSTPFPKFVTERSLRRNDRAGSDIIDAIITRAGRDEDVVLIGFAVEGIEIAVEGGGVDVFVRIAEGEIVENIGGRTYISRAANIVCRNLRSRRLG